MQYNKKTKTLFLSFDLNEELKDIPEDTEIISFDYFNNFNQKIKHLPQSLTHLNFGYSFNQKIKHLPKNLIHLHFEYKFNQKLDKLPKNLKYLHLGWCFQNEIILPKNLKELKLTCNNNFINNIPKHIEKVYILFSGHNKNNKRVENLPLTIKEIIIEDEYYKKYIKIPFGSILTIKNKTMENNK
jgi:hypothetical protein